MRKRTVRAEATTAGPREAVWALLADVTLWPTWSPFDAAEYEHLASDGGHGVGAVRRLRISRLHSRETVLAFSPPTRLSYAYEGSLPVTGYRGDVTLTENPGGTHIRWEAEFTPTIPFTGRALQIVITKVLRDVSTSLARAAQATTSVTLPPGVKP